MATREDGVGGRAHLRVTQMIVFDLRCVHGHGFEGWFASSEEFVRQQDANLVRCPVCDDAHVERMPSARVRVSKGAARSTRRRKARRPPSTSRGSRRTWWRSCAKSSATPRTSASASPRKRARIHYQETPARAIRGKASREDAEALTDEGIEFASLPPILTRDQH